MGIYSEYLNKNLSFDQITAERKAQLNRISRLRDGRDVLVFAADLTKGNTPNSVNYADLLPINDQLANLHHRKLDFILETPGGSGEVAEDIVRSLRGKFDEIAVLVPGTAKSAGTIMAMAGDEILMEPSSSLGPIDAQLYWQGKVFSAHALIEGFEKIKAEVAKSNTLNRAYIPMLQGISPGELQSAQNALDFAKTLVTDWLTAYKFKNWEKHSSSGKPVTPEERKQIANGIADQLCDHGKWKTHGRSITIKDLRGMGLKIVDYSENHDLHDAIRRYHTLLQMTFSSNVYKVVETPASQIYRFSTPSGAGLPTPGEAPPSAATVEIACAKCNKPIKLQARLDPGVPLESGCLPFPATNRMKCPSCGAEIDLSDLRRQIEAMTKRRVIP